MAFFTSPDLAPDEMNRPRSILLVLVLMGTSPSSAQELATPAYSLFGEVAGPAPLASEAVGFYAGGCLAGGEALPVDGPYWQAMRLSRNRYWGHPSLVAYLERLAADAAQLDGWPGLLVGDMSQPRGVQAQEALPLFSG